MSISSQRPAAFNYRHHREASRGKQTSISFILSPPPHLTRLNTRERDYIHTHTLTILQNRLFLSFITNATLSFFIVPFYSIHGVLGYSLYAGNLKVLIKSAMFWLEIWFKTRARGLASEHLYVHTKTGFVRRIWNSNSHRFLSFTEVCARV